MNHPATGPITPEQMRALADAPYGKAAEVLRKHDPMWGKLSLDGDAKITSWKVFVTQEVTMEAYVTVEATSAEEAMEIAETMSEGEFSWDFNCSDSVVVQSAESL